MDSLDALSPLDGRYRKQVEGLSEIFSERGLMKNRVKVEGEYIISLSQHPKIGVRTFSEDEKGLVRGLHNLSPDDARIIKTIETQGFGEIKKTNHDVKAVEYYMKEKLKRTSLEDCLEWIHFALTSEDVNNLAYGLMLSDGLGKIIIPTLDKIVKKIDEFSERYKSLPMLTRTHGQPASPSTYGKEFRVFSSRLERQVNNLKSSSILAKLNGATGNYNAHYVAYPDVDWIDFSRKFIEEFNEERMIKLSPNFVTTQIEPHDTYAELFDNLKRVNNILIDFSQDMWRYISDEWIVQKPIEGEVSSSTMPHKVNPIDLENGEGNCGLSNSLCDFFSVKLPISRLQRDLSDSTVERNFGVALGYGLVAYNSLLKGLGKISVNEQRVLEELDRHPEVISEAIQTILRREGIDGAYEQLKDLTRGKKVTLDDFRIFIDGLDVSNGVKDELRAITPRNYIGIAERIVNV